jgi:hypothetical protein
VPSATRVAQRFSLWEYYNTKILLLERRKWLLPPPKGSGFPPTTTERILFMKRNRDKAFLEKEIRFIFYDSVNEKYADIILEQKNISGISLLDEIINYVMDSQEWEAGTYSDADIRLAIGKTLTKRLGCSIQK